MKRSLIQKSALCGLLLTVVCNGCNGSISSGDAMLPRNGSNGIISGDPLLRNTIYGPVAGIETASGTWAWLGVPYAQPPVGELRWKAPRDPEPWTETIEADGFCEMCPQFGGLMGSMEYEKFGEYMGGEDCLKLNIWRPRSAAKKLPVMFWIHGGGNSTGQAALTMYHGAVFAARMNMVFVSINYRVGPMGWMTHECLRTGDPLDDSGNFGTLDIIKALGWVSKNIEAFGGDPGNVTIAGQSAGAMNVYSMIVSPKAAGLFHRAIAMSGNPGATPKSSGEAGAERMIVSLLVRDGYAADEESAAAFMESKGNAWLGAYLRSKSAQEIYGCFTAGPAGMITDSPGEVFDDGTVINGDPLATIASGNYNRVPLMLGFTSEEVKVFLPLVIGKISEKELCQMVQEMDPDNPTIELTDIISPFMVPLYEPVTLLGTIMFGKSSYETADRFAKYQKDVYFYKFMWDEEPAPMDFIIGAAHAIDIPFAFGTFDRSSESVFRFAWSGSNRAAREELSCAMMNYFARFARTGNPNGDGAPAWVPYRRRGTLFTTMFFDSGKWNTGDDVIAATVSEESDPAVPDLVNELLPYLGL